MYRLSLVNSPLSRNCGRAEETLVHHFAIYPADDVRRWSYLGTNQLGESTVGKLSLHQLVDFFIGMQWV